VKVAQIRDIQDEKGAQALSSPGLANEQKIMSFHNIEKIFVISK
jgi:hypothetical protein